jgi:hypothetical protein
MLEVLKTVPHVAQPRVGVLGLDQLAKGAKAPTPFVGYAYENKSKQSYEVTFVANTDGQNTVFLAWLPGISSSTTGWEDWGTNKITRLWKAKCGVTAGVMTD